MINKIFLYHSEKLKLKKKKKLFFLNLCAASLLQISSIFNPFTNKCVVLLSFEYAKLSFEYNILRVKMKKKFDWDTDVPVGVKSLTQYY